MPSLLRKHGTKPSPTQAPVAPSFQSRIEDNNDNDNNGNAQGTQEVEPTTATPTKGVLVKRIIRLSGGKPVQKLKAPLDPSMANSAAAAEAGFTSKALYPDVAVGEIVKITNSMFPWVTHYAPGESCRVESIAPYLNGAHEDPVKFRIHTLKVLSDGKHKGNMVTLFRHEFIPLNPDAAPLPPGRVTIVR